MIVYLISSYTGINTGRGGHYYSLKTISSEVANTEETLIINIGDFRSPALSKHTQQVIYVNHHLHNTVSVMRRLIGYVRGLKISAVHSFDRQSIFFGRALSYWFEVPLISTKCGGPSYPKNGGALSYYPQLHIQTVFHNIDKEYFEALSATKAVYNIPGRVKLNHDQRGKSEEIEAFFNDTNIKIMRICRISHFYYSTIEGIINLLNRQRTIDPHSKLVIIGYVADKEYLFKTEVLIAEADLGLHILLLTDEDHTIEASRFLHYANVVLGTGRSFMEAASYGHLMLAPVSGSSLPALVHADNVSLFECHNFSTRTPNDRSVDFHLNGDDWLTKINDSKLREQYSRWMIDHFHKVYSVEAATVEYLGLYKKSALYERMSFDLIFHFLKLHLSMIKLRTRTIMTIAQNFFIGILHKIDQSD